MKLRNEPKQETSLNSRLLDISSLCSYLSLGRNRASSFAKEIGCEVHIGRRVLYDRMIIDRYFDEKAKEKAVV